MSGTIFRAQRTVDNPWVQVHRDAVRDQTLSYAARGMLAFILSHPDDWRITNQYLIDSSPGGREATATIIRELRAAGYMHRERVKSPGGWGGWETVVYELPVLAQLPAPTPPTAKPSMPSTGKPRMAPTAKPSMPSTGKPSIYEGMCKEGMSKEEPPYPPPADGDFAEQIEPTLAQVFDEHDTRSRLGIPDRWTLDCADALDRHFGGDVAAARAFLEALPSWSGWEYHPRTAERKVPKWLRSVLADVKRGTVKIGPELVEASRVAAWLAKQCGSDFGMLSDSDRDGFRGIAEDGTSYGLGESHLRRAIQAARSEPKYATGGIPHWLLRQKLAAVVAPVTL